MRGSVVFFAASFCPLICGSGDVRAFLGGELTIFRPVGLARPSSIVATRGLVLGQEVYLSESRELWLLLTAFVLVVDPLSKARPPSRGRLQSHPPFPPY